MAKNSHIQITQRLLENFSHKVDEPYNGHPTLVDFVYYLDLSDYRIGEKRKREFGADYGFYSDEVENLLSDNAEGPFGETISKLCKKTTNLSNYSFSQQELKSIANFAFYSISRSKKVFDTIKSTTTIKKEQISNNEIIEAVDVDDNFIADDCVVIFENKTQIEFIIPFNCLTYIKWHEELLFVLFVSPTIALGLCRKTKMKKQVKTEYTAITSTNLIDEFNKASVRIERSNRYLLVAKSKQTLCRLLHLLNKPVLEKESEA